MGLHTTNVLATPTKSVVTMQCNGSGIIQESVQFKNRQIIKICNSVKF